MSQLIDNLEGKRVINNNGISYIEQEKPKTQADIELFSPTLVKVDNDIVTLVGEINSLKSQIVTLSTNAFAVGCGTTAGVTTIFPDRVVTTVPNYCVSTYDGIDPYGISTSQSLSSSNVGIGSFLSYNKSDSSQSGIGSLFGDIGNCYRTPCTSAVCVSTASSITILQNRITTLQAQVSSLTTKSNAVKEQRSEYEIARYGYNQTTKILVDKNTQIGIAISCIKETTPTS